MYNLHSFLNSALHGGDQPASSSDRLTVGEKRYPVPTEGQAGWNSEPVWMLPGREKHLTLAGKQKLERPARKLVTIPTGLRRLP